MAKIGVILPTWNNNEYLLPCLNSLLNPLSTEDMIHIYIVNNGDAENMKAIDHPRVTILQQETNLGWEGGLKKGLEASKEEFVVFMNDDTYIPLPSLRWANKMIEHFKHPEVGAVGPGTNVVMGAQNIFANIPYYLDVMQANFLIGFCVMIRREALEKAGGIDISLPGGDDLDLSIRLRKAGYVLLIDRNVFIYHHGFKTGERVKGGPEIKGGWNSVEMMERTNFALMEKHGLKEWISCMNQVNPGQQSDFDPGNGWHEDSEGEVIRKIADGKVLELGCGMRKTVPDAVGVDVVPHGTQIPGVREGLLSVADIIANAQGPIPVESGSFDTVIARHVLEHIVHEVDAIREWRRVLKHGGKLVIAVPNHDLRNTIPLNWEHVKAWTPKSLQTFMESQGWKTTDMLDPKNHVSLVGVFEANGNGI